MRALFGYIGSEKIDIDSYKDFHNKNLHVYCNSNLKFQDDKIYLDTAKFIVVLDGVILNKTELLEKANRSDWTNYFTERYIDDRENLLNDLRGEFSGLVYHKEIERVELFNNPTGTKQIFYYQAQDKFAFASSAIDLITLVKQLEWSLEVDSNACYSFLAYGALLKECSWISYSAKLKAGHVLSYSIGDNQTFKKAYKSFYIKEDHSQSKQELLDEFDRLLTRAVKLEWDKDREYGYTSFSTLSGGLDSRVNVMLARELGFTKQVNFCCSQKDYADETISREMALSFGHDYHFHPLDGLEHFYEADYMNTKIGGGNVYMGPAHLRYGIDRYWNESYGIIHSGQLGDAFLGGFLTSPSMLKPNLGFGRESYEVLPANTEFEKALMETYPNEEIFKMYERGFQVTNSGFWVLEDLSYYTSPFLDIDLLDFLAKLPYTYKYKRTFYLEWMIKYHPEMTKYKWEYVHSKPNAVWKTKYATTFMRLKYGWKKLLSPEFRLKFDMSPEQYWYNNSKELQAFYRKEIDTHFMELESIDFPYKTQLEQFGNSGSVNQLSKALSMLIILKIILK